MNSKVLFSAMLLLAVVVAMPAQAIEAEVVMVVNPAGAANGGAGISVANSALVGFTLADLGIGITTLAASYGNGTAAISLPVGVGLAMISNPPGACSLVATQWINSGGGLYFVRFSPVALAGCTWKTGTYVFRLNISAAGYQAVSAVELHVP
jgi:hypothetical protein